MNSVNERPDNVEYQSRKPYQKPHIEQVKLVPEETVLGGCKTTNYPIAVVGTEIGCGIDIFSPCLNDGS